MSWSISSSTAVAGVPSQGPTSELWLVDGHVHIHDCFDLDRFLTHAAENVAGQARAVNPSLGSEAIVGCLMLTESAGTAAFEKLRGLKQVGVWQISPTQEPQALEATCPGRIKLLVMAGRQIVTAERLEVLALGTCESFPDGQPLQGVLAQCARAGILSVLPWGLGKWTLARGQLIENVLSSQATPMLFVGDNGGRWRRLREPKLLAKAGKLGIRNLPGTDPLPLPGQESKAGRYGFVLEGDLDATRPVESIKRWLRERSGQPACFGQGEKLTGFIGQQIAMQWRNRVAGRRKGIVTEKTIVKDRVLVIAPQPFFSPRGTPFSVYYRTMVTAEQGLAVDLLTYGQGQDVDLPDVRIIRTPALRWMGAVKVGPSWRKAVHDVFMVAWTIGLLLRRRYRYVHAHEEAIFWCQYLKPVFRFKLAYDMHSSLPQQLSNFKFTRSRILIGMFDRLERGALRRSDAVITICPDLQQYALAQGVPAEKHILIENSIFEDVRLKPAKNQGAAAQKDSPPTPPQTTVAELLPPSWNTQGSLPGAGGMLAGGTLPGGTLPGGVRVVYAGTFEHYQGIDLLIRGFQIVHQALPGAKLLLVGGMPAQVEAMRKLADECRLTEVCHFTGMVPKTMALKLLATADLLVSPRTEGTNTPLKVYEQLASGKPLVATSIWSHTQVLNDDVCFLAEATAEDFGAAMLRALQEPQEARRRAQAAQSLYQRDYARDIYEAKMRRFLKAVR
ncbi:MAG: glycosyltransferase [Phycisphaeraceae bacterium]|nr:glycosyltransferase [Phycisphaeraceae bacterium]